MGEVKVESHNIQLTHTISQSKSIGHPIPELQIFSKFDLENQGSVQG